jgi:TetR/AcrR family transcriptional regulator, transcriptional repressor for nem operon
MARPRDFDSETVLAQIADVFTEHGFQGTSMSALSDATGLGKQSLYNTFGDKEALYLQAVDVATGRYADVAAIMASSSTGRAAIDAFFSTILGSCISGNPAKRNCIVSSGLLECIQVEPITTKLEEKWLSSRRLLLSALERGQKDGSVRADQPATALADHLITLVSGLRVSAQVYTNKTQLSKIVQLGLEVLAPT